LTLIGIVMARAALGFCGQPPLLRDAVFDQIRSYPLSSRPMFLWIPVAVCFQMHTTL
jgi:hypothetical protein